MYDGTKGLTEGHPLKTDTPEVLADKDAIFVKWDGLPIHCKLTSKPSEDALTLVLLHGFSGSMSNFNMVRPACRVRVHIGDTRFLTVCAVCVWRCAADMARPRT